MHERKEGKGKIGEWLRKKRAREAWGAEGSWAYRLGSRRVLGRAWALWFQAVGSKIQVDTGGRCLSPGRAGTLLGGTGQAKQPLGGRSDPGQWTKSSASEGQAGYSQGAQGLGWVSALSFLLAGSGPGDWRAGGQGAGRGSCGEDRGLGDGEVRPPL